MIAVRRVALEGPTPAAILQGIVPSVPEKRLMLAVLEGAIGDFQRYATASSGRGRRLFADASAWLESTSTTRFLDFENVCDALGLDPAWVRDGLRRWRAARRASHRASRAVPFPLPLPADAARATAAPR